MRGSKVFVFCGKFKNRAEACSYSEPQWEPEPAGSTSDEEYERWEERNPIKKLQRNIDSYLDEDFIETVELDFGYLSSINISDTDLAKIKTQVNEENFLVLVYKQALGGFRLEKEPVSTDQLKYCGHFGCTV